MDVRASGSTPGGPASGRSPTARLTASPAKSPMPYLHRRCSEIAVIGLELGPEPIAASVPALFSRFCSTCLTLDVDLGAVTCLYLRVGREGRSVCRLRVPPALGGALLCARRRLADTAPEVSIDVWRMPEEQRWQQEQRQSRRWVADLQAGRADDAATWRRVECPPAQPTASMPVVPLLPLAPASAAVAAHVPVAHPGPLAPPAPLAVSPVPLPPSPPVPPPPSAPQGVVVLDNEEAGQWHAMEGIVDQRGRGRGTQYRCRFVGCDEGADEWLPASQISEPALAVWRRGRRRQGGSSSSQSASQIASQSASQIANQPDSAPVNQPASQPDAAAHTRPAHTTADGCASLQAGSSLGAPAPAASRRSRRRAGLSPTP
jgi:hypothetical protein